MKSSKRKGLIRTSLFFLICSVLLLAGFWVKADYQETTRKDAMNRLEGVLFKNDTPSVAEVRAEVQQLVAENVLKDVMIISINDPGTILYQTNAGQDGLGQDDSLFLDTKVERTGIVDPATNRTHPVVYTYNEVRLGVIAIVSLLLLFGSLISFTFARRTALP